jgi:hypothetical protein
MTASRLILQSSVVLFACVVGFVMGRMGAAPRAGEPGERVTEALSDWAPLEPGWDLDLSRPPRESVPAMTQPQVDSTSGLADDKHRGPNRQFYPEAVQGDAGPGPFSGPSTAEPIRGDALLATAAQIQALIQRELPGLSELDQSVWAEELEGMTLESAREVLMLRQALDALEDAPARDSGDPEQR